MTKASVCDFHIWKKAKFNSWQHSNHQLINSHWCKETKQQAGKYSSESKYQTEGFQIAVSIVGKQSIQRPLGKMLAPVLIQETSHLLTHKTQIQARAGAISQKNNASGRQPKYFFHQGDKKGRGKMELKIGSHQGIDAWPRLPVRMLPLCLNFRKLPFFYLSLVQYILHVSRLRKQATNSHSTKAHGNLLLWPYT